MIWIALQWAQVTTGVGFELLREPGHFLPHAVGRWFSSLRDFLADSELTLTIANVYTVCPRREGDLVLMDEARTGNYTSGDVQAINRCRLYLQVECLSDICTADGLGLDPGLKARPPTVSSQSMIQWPRQELPGKFSWAVWRRFLRQYTPDSSLNQLREALGAWTHPELRTWSAYYDPSTEMLCRRVTTPANAPSDTAVRWKFHTSAIKRNRRFLEVPTTSDPIQDSHPGPNAIPVTILHETTDQLRCSLPAKTVTDTTSPRICATFADYVASLPQWEQDLLVHVKEYVLATPLFEVLQKQNANLLAVSDGGADAALNYGSFGWVLGTDKEILWECKGIARGYPMTSYRAEGYGRISVLSFLTHYIRFLEIQPHDTLRIVSYCDNTSLLGQEETFHTRDIDSSSMYTKPDHDIIMQLSALRANLPFHLASLHVRGHQDEKCDFKLLPRPAQLNVLADRLATEVLMDLRAAATPTEFYPLPACRAYLMDDKGYITSKEKQTLMTEFSEYELRAYLQDHNNWTETIYESINWPAYQSSSSRVSITVKTFVIKHSTDWLPVGVREKRYGAATDTCPKCNQTETNTHLYTCQSRTAWRKQFITQLRKHLIDTSTAADLRCSIVEGIESWLLTGEMNDPESPNPALQIGWFGVIKGFIPNHWNTLQTTFLKSQGLDAKYHNGELWTNRLIEFFWTQSHTLWKDRCTSSHELSNDSSDKPSSRARQTAEQQVELAYAYSPRMLAHDRRIFDIPLEERLKTRTSDLVAWTKAMLPVIHQSLHDAQDQVNTGHQDIREYFPVNATPAEQHMTPATNATEVPNTNSAGTRNELLALRERLQQARTELSSTSTTTAATPANFTATAATATATTATSSDNANQRIRTQPTTTATAMATATSRTRQRPLLAIRQRMQQARTRLTTTNAATAAQNDSISRARQHLIEIRQRFQHAGTQVATLSSDIRRFFPGRSNAS
jgi:hypothetical protein